ncbi:MAG: hypothetical protein P1Q69_07000 [Candidatus Thorarchaeota archaeon]|nr:hypothetical protein [Candidatus Thorarchaeota archaeon]
MNRLKYFEILNKKARVICDEEGYGYYSLIEFSDGSHYPIPKLTGFLRFWARTLEVIGIRGFTWHFSCQVCGKESFFTYRNSTCSCCGTEFYDDMSFSLDSENISPYYRNRIIPELWGNEKFQEIRDQIGDLLDYRLNSVFRELERLIASE